MGRASVVQPEVLSLYLKILYHVEGMPNVHFGVINENDNIDENEMLMMLMMLAMLLTFHPKPTSASDQLLSLSRALYKHRE